MGPEGYYVLFQTPTGGRMGEQDAYFMRCIEIIAGTWNQKISEARKKS